VDETFASLMLDGGRIREIAVVRNPEKVGRVNARAPGRVRRLDKRGT
jgi:hypothetical protein